MKRILTKIKELTRIPLVGETEAGSAGVQPIRLRLRAGSARDSQLKATNCRWGVSYTPAIPFYEQGQFGAFSCLKKTLCRRQGSLPSASLRTGLTAKWICPIHAEPVQRSIESMEQLQYEVYGWQQRRDATTWTVDWRFTTDAARIKLKKLYPSSQE
jgi:hypothetical protein